MLTLFTQSDIRYLNGDIVSVQGEECCSKTDNPLDKTKHEKSSHTHENDYKCEFHLTNKKQL
jgi:hypothetical protein